MNAMEPAKEHSEHFTEALAGLGLNADQVGAVHTYLKMRRALGRMLRTVPLALVAIAFDLFVVPMLFADGPPGIESLAQVLFRWFTIALAVGAAGTVLGVVARMRAIDRVISQDFGVSARVAHTLLRYGRLATLIQVFGTRLAVLMVFGVARIPS